MNKSKCLGCQIEFESKRKDAKFCSDACRKFFKRKKVKKVVSTPQIVVAPRETTQDLSKLTPQELYEQIGFYPHDTWKDSPEHEELTKRLNEMSVEELEKESYFIPLWKYNQKKNG